MEFIKVAEPLVGQEECNAVCEVLLSGNYVSGKKVQEFEARYAEYIGTKYAVMVNSGTAALHIIMAAQGIGPGDEVIVPGLTFFSTATAVIHQNAIPIFADIDEHYCMDPASVEQVITARTKAIIPVHYFGYMADMTPLLEIARRHNLLVIEDCAQAHGAEYYGKKAGALGHAGAFSFFATKNMTTGEGGGITTDDEELAKKAKLIRAHGMINRDDHALLGYNYRMTEMEAAFGMVQLAKLEAFNAARIRNSEYLLNNLRDLDWLAIETFDPSIKHVYFWCPIRVLEEKTGKPASDFGDYLKANGIGFRQRYQEPLNRQIMLLEKNVYPKQCPFSCPYYGKEVDYAKVRLPNAEKFCGKIFGLPNHPKLEPRHLDRVLEVVRAYR
jgi:perosamine synthetase